jgi:hypothetical protein
MVRAISPDADDARNGAPPRELDSRTSDGIHVQLLWHPRGGYVSVVVNDTKTGDTFELEVSRDQRALDVYHHPFAYAAASSDRRPAAAQLAH